MQKGFILKFDQTLEARSFEFLICFLVSPSTNTNWNWKMFGTFEDVFRLEMAFSSVFITSFS